MVSALDNRDCVDLNVSEVLDRGGDSFLAAIKCFAAAEELRANGDATCLLA
jgi:hypothetical protein